LAFDNRKAGLENGIKIYLDVVRIVAAVLVLLGHSFYAYGISVLKDDTYFPPVQSIAVVAFFWLSGFLMAYQFMNWGDDFSIKEFTIHKIRRIIPEYWICLLAVLGVDYLHLWMKPDGYNYGEAFNGLTFIGNMFFLQGVPIDGIGTKIQIFGSARPLWTLPVQWWFYFATASVYIVVKRKKIRITDLLFSAFIILLGIVLLKEFGFIFALGIIGYFLYGKISKCLGGLMGLGSGILFLAYEYLTRQVFSNYSVLLFSISLIGWAAFFRDSHYIPPKWLRSAGLISFELYLIHYSVIDYISDILEDFNALFKFSLGIAISIIVSIAIFIIVDRTYKKIIKKLIR